MDATNTVMSTGDIFDYSGSDGAAYHEARKLPAVAEDWIARVRAEKIEPHIKATDSVLEYGVGFGWNLISLNCSKKVGYDVAAGLRNSSAQKSIAFVDDEELLSDETFDVVLCHHTLEHLRLPAEALRSMHRVLKPDGRLLIFVPYEMERKYRSYNANDRTHHLFSWTPASLSNLVITVGFEVHNVQLRRFRFDRRAALIALKLNLGERAYRLIRKVALAILPEYEIQLIASKRLA